VNTSELIDHVTSTAMVDDALIATVKKGDAISLLGPGSYTPMARAARQGRDPLSSARVALAGARSTPGPPFAAAQDAKSGARKAASAKAAKGPAGTIESVTFC
jgi:nucleoid DNA-binding protein